MKTNYLQRIIGNCLLKLAFPAAIILSCGSLFAQLSGTYTIGAGQNYETFTAACEDLGLHGLSGPVVFNVIPGTYNEQFVVPYIATASETNTITFQSSTGDSTDVIIQYDAENNDDNFIMKIKQSQYVTVRQMTFSAQDPTYCVALLFENYVFNFTIEGCRLFGTTNTNATSYRALICGPDVAIQDLTIRHNSFDGGAYGVFMNCSNQYNLRTSIISNTFDNIGYCSINLNKHEYTEITDNLITSGSFGLRLITSSSGILIRSNILHDVTYTGFYITNMKSAAGFESSLTNNSISMNGYVVSGIEIRSSSFVNLYNNTVLLNSERVDASVLYLAYNIDQTINIMNNNLVTLSLGYAIYTNTAEQAKECDYNNYYTTAGYFAFWGEKCEDFRTLKMVSGKDEHSLFAYPNFVSESEPVPNSAWLDGAGTPLADVTVDLTGIDRDPDHPDIGAWEFTASQDTKPPMHGAYTLGTGGDFASLNEAIGKITVRGIDDSVRLQYLPGYYEEQCIITPITGANSKRPLIIESSTGEREDVHIWFNAENTDDNYVLMLKGTSFLHLKNLTFHAMDDRYARIFDLQGMVDSLHVQRCNLESTEQSDANGNAIMITNNNINFHYQLYEEDTLRNGSTAILMSLDAYISDPGEFHFRNNYLANGYQNILSRHIHAMYITGNRMLSNTYNLNISYTDYDLVIEENYLYGKYGGNIDLNTVDIENFTHAKIINNFMMSDDYNPNRNGLKIYNCNNLDIYYNSLSAYSDRNSYVPGNIQNSDNINLKNNIFYNEGNAYVFYTNNTAFLSADYNCFYGPGLTLAYWNEDCSNLAAIQTSSGVNQHSVQANPGFISLSDLHASSEFINDAGIPISGIDLDIDGQTRHQTNPDIGADEFSIIPNTPPYILNPIPDLVLQEDDGEVEVAMLDTVFNDDDNGDILSYTVQSGNQDIQVEIRNGILFLESTQDYFGNGTVILTAKDLMNESTADTFAVSILSVNDPPVGVDDNYIAHGMIEMCVLDNDYDVETEVLNLVEFMPPEHGIASLIEGTNCISYRPTNFQFPKDTVKYVVGDDDGGKDTALAIISISQVQEGFSSQLLMEEGLSHGSAAWGDYDADGDLDILINGWTGTLENYNTNIYNNTDDGFALSDISLTGVSPGTSNAAAWIDFDNDEDLDLIIMGRRANGNGDINTYFYENNSGYYSHTPDVNIEDLDAGSVDWADYDNDGKLDLLISGTFEGVNHTEIFRNYGSTPYGGWAMGHIETNLTGIWSGESSWVDFDSDGDQDIFICGFGADPSRLYRNDEGQFTAMTTSIPYAGNAASAWCDFDQDGDPDLALTGKADNTYFSKIFRNDGEGAAENEWVFTDIEASMDGMCSGDVEWGDADNDGDPDLFVIGNTSMLNSGARLYINNDGELIQSGDAFTGMGRSCAAWADYDNDGDLDLLTSGYSNTHMDQVTLLYKNDRAMQNQPPSPPSFLNYSRQGDDVVLSWDPAMDDHSISLGYNVRIGSATGLNDILNPMAEADGTRKIIGYGNAGFNNRLIIKGLEPGQTYYWSVQAIDHSYRGSAFAAEQSFTLTTGIGVFYGKELKIFPNPATEFLYLEVPPGFDIHPAVNAYDISGRSIRLNPVAGTSSDKTISFDLKNLKSGVYILIIEDEDEVCRTKFIKK